MARARKSDGPVSTIADQIATFVGKSLGDLINRKQALQKQLSEIDAQISGVRDLVSKQLGRYASVGGAATRRRRGRPLGGGKRKSGKTTRVISAETRAKMAASARKRWSKARKPQA
jgi:hypothetical protein